jgi:hypothetical protein
MQISNQSQKNSQSCVPLKGQAGYGLDRPENGFIGERQLLNVIFQIFCFCK